MEELASRKRDMAVLVLATLVAELGFGIIIPSLPGYVTEVLGAETTLLGLIISIFALFNALFKIPMGVLSDRYGRKRMIVGGLVVSALAPFLMTLIRVPLLFLPIRAMDGMGNAAIFPAANALITDTTSEKQRATAMSMLSMAGFFGSGVGPMLGGLIFGLTGSYLAPFYYSAAFILGGAVITLLALSEPVLRKKAIPMPLPVSWDGFRQQISDSFTAIQHRPVLRTLVWVCFLLLLGLGLLLPTYILYIQIYLGFSPQLIGVVFTASTFASLFALIIAGRLADHFGRRPLIVSGISLLLVSLASVVFIHGQVELIVISSLAGIGGAVLLPALLARVSELCPSEGRGAALGFIGTVQGLGLVFGPVIGGWLWDRIDPRAPFLLCSLSIAIALVLVIWQVTDAVRVS